MKKLLIIFLSLILSYIVLEFWAQVRFSLNNQVLPFGLRKNMGINLYEAHKLTPNFMGRSGRGIDYATDEYGFSVNPKGDPNFKDKIMIAGDSRAFSLFLEWEDSLAGQLEDDGIGVYLEAFPGSSPALFIHHVFSDNLFYRLNPKPKRVYYLYDRNDTFGDQQFMKEMELELPWYHPRKVKIALGGYFWNMAKLKINSFLNKAKPHPSSNLEPMPPINKIEPPIQNEKAIHKEAVFEVHRETLLNMKKLCESADVPLVMVYLPRFPEALGKHTYVRDNLRAWCLEESVDFIDLYEPFSAISAGQIETIRPYFRDLNEGIHYSKKGLSLVKDAILQYEREHP